MNKLIWVISFLIITSFSTFADETVVERFTPKDAKIIGGVKAPIGAWPSTVALLDVNTLDSVLSGTATYATGGLIPISEANYQAQVCGASLIASNWVLTAAHCVVDQTTGAQKDSSVFTTLVGTSDLLNGGDRMSIKRIIVHPSYNYTTLDSDIALIELDLLTAVETIIIPPVDVPTGIIATVVGWGDLDETDALSIYPTSLYEVDVPIVDRSICDSVYSVFGASTFTDNMICAGYSEGGKDTCQADSGGPLMALYDGEVAQVGITSWGIGCAQPGLYGVYTRVANFKGWVDSYVLTPGISSSGTFSPYVSSSGGGSIFYLLLPFFLIVSIRRFINKTKSNQGISE